MVMGTSTLQEVGNSDSKQSTDHALQLSMLSTFTVKNIYMEIDSYASDM